jgi:hypothetical protein
MKSYFSIALLAALLIFVHGNFDAAADENGQPGSGVPANAWYEQTCRDAPSDKSVGISTDIYLAGDSDRGCCVLKAPETKCVYTNKAFCMRKAGQANIPFEFFNGVECKTIDVCK